MAALPDPPAADSDAASVGSMRTSRSRSSTVSSCAQPQRSPVAEALQPLAPAPLPPPAAAAHPPTLSPATAPPAHPRATPIRPFDQEPSSSSVARGATAITNSSSPERTQFQPKSYHSQHSLRTIRPGDRQDASASPRPSPPPSPPSSARRNGPQFVIELDGGAGRPRADTFGGVQLPPAAGLVNLEPGQSPYRQGGSAGGDPARRDSDDDTDDAIKAESPLLAQRGRNSSVSSLSSLRSLDPSLHLGGAPLRERRPVLFAGLQAGALLLAAVLGLYLTLKLALPPIDPEHRDKVHLPKSFDDLKELNEVLQVYSERNYYRVMGCWVAVYLFLQAFSVPGSMYMSILGGALWGVLVALPLVCFSVATGALLCYCLSAALGPAVLSHSEKWQHRIDRWADRVREHDKNLLSYLIVIRIAPLPPHWVVNIAAYHVGISPWKFWWSTFLGIAGVSYIHTQIGTTLDQMTSSADFHLISWQNGVGLGGIIVAVLIPVALRRAFADDIADAADDNDDDDAEAGAEGIAPRGRSRTSRESDRSADRAGGAGSYTRLSTSGDDDGAHRTEAPRKPRDLEEGGGV
ncbi:hypothetical protein JCM8202_005035 [Rhodotorula sphaerocarpa]